ncbi:plasmid mobilization protein [Chitinophaga sp.]|uniref:plasmid mobilization protein n=1 Tax=Chitinophaga sp. TaxID=1869181 RepID=UPI002F91BFF5
MERSEQRPKSKGGRPAKAVRKEKQFSLRFTEAEFATAKEKAANAGFTLTMYLRKMTLFGEVKARQNEEEKQGVKQLIAMASNINQMAKMAHQQGFLTAMMLFETYRKQFDELINRLTND